jgi:hypothetical protein
VAKTEVFPPTITTGTGGNPISLRDANGELRPQAAAFRVFEVERQGARLVSAREVKSAEAVITWRVHVINRKAAGQRFTVPGTSIRNTDRSIRRNEAKNTDDLSDPANQHLIIDSGVQTADSTSAAPVSLQGAFKGQPVSLGRIFTGAATVRCNIRSGIADTVHSGRALSSAGLGFPCSFVPNETMTPPSESVTAVGYHRPPVMSGSVPSCAHLFSSGS